jgi:TolB-like protein
MGRFLADTLLTDLARSEHLRLVERAQIGRTLTELRLQSTGLTEPQQVQKIGKILGADRLIVGSYLLHGTDILINARLLDVHTGRVAPGSAANANGSRDDLQPTVERLAGRLHRRITGTDLPTEGDPAPTQRAKSVDAAARPLWSYWGDPYDATALSLGLWPQRYALSAGPPIFRGLIGADWWTMPSLNRVPQGIASVGREAQPRSTPPHSGPDVHAPRNPGSSDAGAEPDPIVIKVEAPRFVPDPDGFTGLIVEAFGLPVERAMSARILDEDGRVIYPEAGREPSEETAEDLGTIAYYHSGADATRAGQKPLNVPALQVSGDDLIVSRETGDRILNENRRTHFLWEWRVCFLVDSSR